MESLQGFEQKGMRPNCILKGLEGKGGGDRGKGKSRRTVRKLLQSSRLEAVVAWFTMVTVEEVRGS